MGIKSYSRAAIIQRLFNQPLAVLPDTAAIVLGAVGPRLDVGQLFVEPRGLTLGIGTMEGMAAEALAQMEARGAIDRRAGLLPAKQLGFVFNRVMHVGIRGETVAENDGSIGPSSGFTGYDGIRAQVQAADNDPEVAGILLDIDSPGGEVSGLYELTDFLMARRGRKPMRAMIRGVGASAAYSVAACADPGQVTLHPLGLAGSNGVITMHADFSEQLAQDGIKVTLISSGSHKADGNPFEPLPDDVRARIQSMVDTAATRLFDHVGKARGMKPAAVRDQQAQIYHGEEAVKAGLVDKILGWEDSMNEFEAMVNGGQSRSVARAPLGATVKETEMEVLDQAAIDAARAEGHAEGVTAGTTAERGRIVGLVAIDGKSSLSEGCVAAIDAGTSVGDHAIALAQSAKQAGPAALAAARADAAAADQLPAPDPKAAAGGAERQQVNRGQAYAEKKAAAKP